MTEALPAAMSSGTFPSRGVPFQGDAPPGKAADSSESDAPSGRDGVAVITPSPESVEGKWPPGLALMVGAPTGGDAIEGGEADAPAPRARPGSPFVAGSSTGREAASVGAAGPSAGSTIGWAGTIGCPMNGTAWSGRGAGSETGGIASFVGRAVSSPVAVVCPPGTASASAEAVLAPGVGVFPASSEPWRASRSPKPDASATDSPFRVAGRAGAIIERMACADMDPRGVAGAMVAGAPAAPNIQRQQRKSRASSIDRTKTLKRLRVYTQGSGQVSAAPGPNLPCADLSCPAPGLR